MSGAGNLGGSSIPGSAYGAIRSADPNSRLERWGSRATRNVPDLAPRSHGTRVEKDHASIPFHPLPAQSIRSCDDIPERDKSLAVWISIGLFVLVWLGLPGQLRRNHSVV